MFAKGKMGKVIFVTIAGLMILTLGFSSGVYYCQSTYEPVIVEKHIHTPIYVLPPSYYKEQYASPISLADALDIIREARYIHQDIVDRPQYANSIRGGVEFHKRWVTRYDQLRELILSLTSME